MEQNWIKSDILDDVLDARAYQMKFIENIIKLRECGLPLKKLNLLCGGIYRGNTPAHIEGKIIDGALLLKTVNIRSNELDVGKVFSMESSIYEQENRFQLFENDICITIMGATEDIVGRSWVYNKNIGKACFSDGIAKIKNANIDPYYLSTYINSYYGHLSVIQFSGSSTRSYVTNTQLGETLIPTPSAEIQKYIGDKVRKAEELREEAKELKKEAEGILFKELKLSYFNEKIKDAPRKFSWFSDELIGVRVDSQYYINETNFINNIMHEKGLKLKKINEIADIGKGFSYSSLDNKSIPYIRISDLDNLLIDFESAELVDEKTYLDKKSSRLEKYDLIFAITGATIGKVSMVYNDQYDKVTLSADTAYVRFKDKKDVGYTLLYLKTVIGQLNILKGVTGATNRHLSLEHIGDILIPNFGNELKDDINIKVLKSINNIYLSKQLIKEAKQDIEDLIEGKFDMCKIKETN